MRRPCARRGDGLAARDPAIAGTHLSLEILMRRVVGSRFNRPRIFARGADVDRYVSHAVVLRRKPVRQNLEHERDEGGPGEVANGLQFHSPIVTRVSEGLEFTRLSESLCAWSGYGDVRRSL